MAWDELIAVQHSTARYTAEKRGYIDEGRRTIVDCGASWRRFFATAIPSIRSLPLHAPPKKIRCARREDLGKSKEFPDEEGISLDL